MSYAAQWIRTSQSFEKRKHPTPCIFSKNAKNPAHVSPDFPFVLFQCNLLQKSETGGLYKHRMR
ncbi:hypothetical protein CLOSTMETH_00088 [[Clostridium] methylpentosum DSM 5476]|uniref:Uncharacterized protein n=1 Tax=[Clostridium] methylpentosum DSM 5476 TaxID=537013 RepID=C0E8E3_9FIRM|nr:hypothetical protein CLOSTMETH_00088 [[Clostridium] methylpentosum DSM 5476]